MPTLCPWCNSTSCFEFTLCACLFIEDGPADEEVAEARVAEAEKARKKRAREQKREDETLLPQILVEAIQRRSSRRVRPRVQADHVNLDDFEECDE